MKSVETEKHIDSASHFPLTLKWMHPGVFRLNLNQINSEQFKQPEIIQFTTNGCSGK